MANYYAIYEGHHDTRPDYSPEITCTAAEFARDNGDQMAEHVLNDIAADGRAQIGGGAAPAFTIFPDPDYDPAHEGSAPA